MRKHLKWLVVLAAFMLIAAACGDDDDAGTTTTAGQTTTTEGSLEGTTVVVFGPESSNNEAGAMEDALNAFSARSGIRVFYTGARDFSDQINAQAAGGNPPDIAIFPQPGKIADFARQGFLEGVPDSVVSANRDTWPAGSYVAGNVDGTQYAVPNKSDFKSMVWYNTSIFADRGYAIPNSWDELMALTDTMIADGVTPWCVGIESGPATGWPFTDWMEDLVMRIEGIDVYDQWVTHQIPFNDPRIVSVGETILNLWNKPGAVFAAGGSIAATPFGDNGDPLAAGDCAMHRQASFFAAFFPEGTSVGPGGQIDWFYFPAVDPDNAPVLTAGTLAAAFRDAPEVWAVMEYLSSPQYADERQAAQRARVNPDGGDANSGYLSANLQADKSNYNDFELSLIEVIQTSAVSRFDGSDWMPAAVGAGTFWTEGTSAVNGNKTVAEAFATIESSWP